ncbi:hypothetical protein NCCP436_28150 [Pseudomonas sp. NCCP-436]|nr:hypothetical protein NCCP436_28150 [Pseudomonas sp. NCCP-436]
MGFGLAEATLGTHDSQGCVWRVRNGRKSFHCQATASGGRDGRLLLAVVTESAQVRRRNQLKAADEMKRL